jgi:hypothetical protein
MYVQIPASMARIFLLIEIKIHFSSLKQLFTKITDMKIFLVLSFALMFFACDTYNKEEATTKSDTATNESAYEPKEGDVTFRDGKVMVWRNNEWKEADNDVTLDNGVVVKRNGEVVRGDDVIVLEDGEIVDKTGRFFDKAGRAVENAWKDAKKGVKEAGKEIKEVFSDDDTGKDKN